MAEDRADRSGAGSGQEQGHLPRRALLVVPGAQARKPKAIGALRHDMIVAYWHIVSDGVDYKDLGPEWLASRSSPEHRTRRLVRQLEALGHKVTIESAVA